MKYRILWLVAAVALAALVIFQPARRSAAPALELAARAPAPAPRHLRMRKGLVRSGEGGVVYVVGAVRSPGLYHVAERARADDAVRAAGGMRPDADPAGVNLAAYVQDGDEIFVPTLGQSTPRVAQRRSAKRKRKASTSANVVDLNSADAALLATVPGIGPTIASRIVAVRERDGDFSSFDELLDVAGMSQSRLDRAQPYLHI